MWPFWAVIFTFWLLIYMCKRCCGKPTSSITTSPEKSSRSRSSVAASEIAGTTHKFRTSVVRTANDRDSDKEERSSVSSDDESVCSVLSEADHNEHHEVVRVGLGQLIVESSRFNALFHRIALGQDVSLQNRQKRWRTFFAVGQLISVTLIIPCFILLCLMLVSMSQDAIRQIHGNWSVPDSYNGSLSNLNNQVTAHESNRVHPPVPPPPVMAVPVPATPAADDSRFITEAAAAAAADAAHSTAIDAGAVPVTTIVWSTVESSTSAEFALPPPFVVHSAKPARYTTGTGFDSGWIPRMKFLLPGLNIDASQLVILFLAVLVCTLVHESGHAVSALVEGLPLDSVGFAFVICFPIAFAKVDVDSASSSSGMIGDTVGKNAKAREVDRGFMSATTRKLRVLCAGVWCNVVFCVACLVSSLLISFCLLLLSSLVSSMCGSAAVGRSWALQRDGVLVTNVSTESAQYGHLLPGDRVTALNGCNIRSIEDLHRCLSLEPFGYCLRDDEVRHINQIKVKANPLKTLSSVLINDQQHSHHKCCGTSPAALAAGMCFSRAEVYNQSFAEVQCLNIRRLLQFKLDNSMCFNSSNNCGVGSNKHCYMPVLDRNERLFIIDKYPGASSLNDSHDMNDVTHAADITEKEKIVIIGSTRDVLSTKFMPSFRNASLSPSATAVTRPFISCAQYVYAVLMYMQTLLNTCAGVSIAIALLNIVPCIHLDGDKIVQVIIGETLHLDRYERFASFLTNAIIYAGTTLVFLTVAVAFGSALLDAW